MFDVSVDVHHSVFSMFTLSFVYVMFMCLSMYVHKVYVYVDVYHNVDVCV